MIILNKILEAWHTNKSDAIAIISTAIAFTLWTAFTLYLAITSLLTGISKTDLIINLMPVLVSVLLFACVRTVWNVSHTHDMVIKLPQPTVHVQRHDDTDAILRFLDSFKSGQASAKIFVGFPDPHLIEGLVALLKTSAGKHFHLYVHPGTLQMFLDAGLFSPRDSGWRRGISSCSSSRRRRRCTRRSSICLFGRALGISRRSSRPPRSDGSGKTSWTGGISTRGKSGRGRPRPSPPCLRSASRVPGRAGKRSREGGSGFTPPTLHTPRKQGCKSSRRGSPKGHQPVTDETALPTAKTIGKAMKTKKL